MYLHFIVKSTQQTEFYLAVILGYVNWHIFLTNSFSCLKNHIQEIWKNHNADIKVEYKKALVIFDQVAFSNLKQPLTWYFFSKFWFCKNIVFDVKCK